MLIYFSVFPTIFCSLTLPLSCAMLLFDENITALKNYYAHNLSSLHLHFSILLTFTLLSSSKQATNILTPRLPSTAKHSVSTWNSTASLQRFYFYQDTVSIIQPVLVQQRSIPNNPASQLTYLIIIISKEQKMLKMTMKKMFKIREVLLFLIIFNAIFCFDGRFMRFLSASNPFFYIKRNLHKFSKSFTQPFYSILPF